MNISRALLALSTVLVASAPLLTGCIAAVDSEPGAEQDTDTEVVGEASDALTSSQALLCATASSDTQSGTSGDVTLQYVNDYDSFGCTITGGFSSGQERCCVANGNAAGTKLEEFFYIKQATSDGFQVTQVSWVRGTSTTKHYIDAFQALPNNGDVSVGGCQVKWEGYYASYSCNNFWLDADGHDDCKRVAIWLSTGALACKETGEYSYGAVTNANFP